MKKQIVAMFLGAAACSLTGPVVALIGVAALGRPSAPAAWTTAGPAGPPVPARMLRLYAAAAGVCPGLPWEVLAAIGTVESANGTASLPGVHRGRNPAGAEGPMQFEPATFAAFDRPVPPGGVSPPSPYDPVDAVYAAARMLCADGASDPARLGAAVFDYNHSASYVAQVLAVARSLGLGPFGPAPAGDRAVEYALAQVGTPYRWGGETPGVGFDCSGLTQAAYASAGVVLPRVAQDQFRAGPAVPDGAPLAPGDLVFFGPTPATATHVGLVVDPAGLMVDAPHPGAAVRVEPFPTVVGRPWGGDLYLGATAPAMAAPDPTGVPPGPR